MAAPNATTAILTNVHFRLAAGDVLGVIGPNGSGKSSLSRVILGIWPPARGSVRLDNAALDQWDPDALGRHLGYMSQMVELFPGTVAENIARMAPEPDSAAVLRAAQAAGAHDMILRLPGGYDTRASATAAKACRSASSSGSRSPARSTATRSWSCSTSRAPVSMAKAKPPCRTP